MRATHASKDRIRFLEPLSIETDLRAFDLLSDPLLNKGTAFTEAERDELQLHGFLPPSVQSLEEQVARRMIALGLLSSDLERHIMLRELQDSNETLFYALIEKHMAEVFPLIYTPVVAQGCLHFSHFYRRPRGVFLSYSHRHLMRKILAHPLFDAVQVMVVTDGSSVLELGDLGVGAMGMPIGRSSVYVACAGVNPRTTLPIMLDVGTDNPDCLNDPLYIGWRHERVRGAEYNSFIDEFISLVRERWPHAVLQWEAIDPAESQRLVARGRQDLCVFDDVEGRGAVILGTLLAAIHVTGVPLSEQVVVIDGTGPMASGLALMLHQLLLDAGLTAAEASRRILMLEQDELVCESSKPKQKWPAGLRAFVQESARVLDWQLADRAKIGLFDVVKNARPTVLIGTSGQAGRFNEPLVREMAHSTRQPIIFSTSSDPQVCEATPAQLAEWSEGRALVAQAAIPCNEQTVGVTALNSAYLNPGMVLAATALSIPVLNDSLFLAAAKALAAISPARDDDKAPLLPAVSELRNVALAVALAVGVRAYHEGLLDRHCRLEQLESMIKVSVWQPDYPIYRQVAGRDDVMTW